MGLAGAFRHATPLPIPDTFVEQCLLGGDRFRRAWRRGLDRLPPADRRGGLSVETGLIAESVATLLLQDLGLDVFAEGAGAGVHGVDILALTPASQVLALEVKGTLRAGGRPRLGRGRAQQMSLAWLSSPRNPAMGEWGLTGLDLYGGVAHLNLALMQWRTVLTQDHSTWLPVRSPDELFDLSVLDADMP